MTTIKQKYDKVKTLSQKGATEGERQAALEAMRRMEEKYPELKSKEKPSINVGGHSYPVWFEENPDDFIVWDNIVADIIFIIDSEK